MRLIAACCLLVAVPHVTWCCSTNERLLTDTELFSHSQLTVLGVFTHKVTYRSGHLHVWDYSFTVQCVLKDTLGANLAPTLTIRVKSDADPAYDSCLDYLRDVELYKEMIVMLAPTNDPGVCSFWVRNLSVPVRKAEQLSAAMRVCGYQSPRAPAGLTNTCPQPVSTRDCTSTSTRPLIRTLMYLLLVCVQLPALI